MLHITTRIFAPLSLAFLLLGVGPGCDGVEEEADEEEEVTDRHYCDSHGAYVSEITPRTLTFNNPNQIVTIQGQCLPPTLALWIADCANLTKLPNQGISQVSFKCTPSYSTGYKSWVVKTTSGGNVLASDATGFGKLLVKKQLI